MVSIWDASAKGDNSHTMPWHQPWFIGFNVDIMYAQMRTIVLKTCTIISESEGFITMMITWGKKNILNFMWSILGSNISNCTSFILYNGFQK